LLIAGFVIAAHDVSAQQVLTFDEIGNPASPPILGEVVCSAGSGLRFTSDHFHVIGPNYNAPFTSTGTTHIGYESVRGFPIVLSRDGTGTFSLFSLDAGEFYSPADPDRPDAQWITLTGHQADGGVVTHSLSLDGVRDGPGGAADLEHFVLPATFVNLRSVTIEGWLPNDVAGGLALDNIEYELDSLEAVPACYYIDSIPTVAFVSPGGVVSGIVTIEANATDNAAIGSVTFKLNGVDMAAPDTTAPYTLQWDTTLLADGQYTLTAEARDLTSNAASATMIVTVQNQVIVATDPHYVSFDGVDDVVRVSDAAALSFGNGTTDTPFTIEAWVRPETLTGRHQIAGKSGEYRVAFIYGTLLVELRDNSLGAAAFASTTSDLSGWVGNWHHIAVTYDGRGGATAADGITIYLDGVAATVARQNAAAYVAMENLANPLESGLDSSQGDPFSGGFDELRLWNVVRTANEIQLARSAEITGVESGLVGYWRFNEGAGLTSADDSPNNNTAALIGGTSWLPDGPLAPDTTAPLISNIVVSNVTAGGATITFTTNESALAGVSYTLTTCPCTDVNSAAVGTSHSVQLTGLAAQTQYQFTVYARDGANNLRTSSSMSFTTLAPTADTQAPTVAFVTPAAGAVEGPVTIEASASDNVAVVSVEFKVDGVSIGAPDTAAPFTLVWNSTGVADGAHTITAEARDAANNLGTASVAVVVQNTPVPHAPHYVLFDGVNDVVQIGDAPALSFGNGTADTPFTIEAWVRPEDLAARHHIVGKSGEYRVAFVYGTLAVELRDDNIGARAFTFTTDDLSGWVGNWHHVAVTYDGRGGATAADGVTIYLDGVAVPVARQNAAAYVAMENLANPLESGLVSNEGDAYSGGVDELRLWNVVRTANQIQAAMSVELTGVESGLVGYWRFNEGVGASVADDSVGASTATLLNGTLWVAGGPLAPAADTTAPQISNIVVSNITPTGATITFTTDEAATGWISYVAGVACPCTDAYSGAIDTSHTITLTGLASDTNYQFEAKALDAASNNRVAAPITFRTLPAPPPTPSVTASTTAALAGATVTATIANGPGNRLDWVAVCPGTSTTGCSEWKYLSGTRVAPASGLTAATVPVAMPAAAGQYSITLFVNDSMTVAARSALVTVTAGGGGGGATVTPSSTTALTGASVTATIANGPGNLLDWVAVCPGTSTTGCSDWKYLSGTRVAPASGLTAATVPVTMPATAGQYSITLFLNDGMTVGARSALITVSVGGGSGSTPTITPASTTVSAGATLSATIANGPGNQLDWVAVCPASGTIGCSDWKYLSGTRVAPASGLTAATVSFTMPSTPGSYTLKFFVNDSMTVAATSAVVTVTAGGGGGGSTITPSATTAAPGGSVTVTIANGPGNRLDWVAVCPGTSSTGCTDWKYLNGTRVAPASGLTAASLPFTMPVTPGQYSFKLFANDSMTVLATSALVTVQ
jgi:hypothetical protein